MSFAVRQIGGRIGAEIVGISLQDEIADDVAQALRDVLYRHKVIFFRGQHDLTDEGQEIFAGRIGQLTLTDHPSLRRSPNAPSRRVTQLDSDKNEDSATDHWHTDSTSVLQPPGGAVLRAVVLPSFGGDTLWANTASAYAHMPQSLRGYLDVLWGVHSNRWGFGHIHTIKGGLIPIEGERSQYIGVPFYGTPFETLHPIVRVHPYTGERCLLAGQHLRHIVDLPVAGSADLARLIHHFVTLPENTIRWRWEKGDVAVWDNRATQHYATRDYTEKRLMHRVSLSGEVPVSVSGETSRARIGSLADYQPPAPVAATAS